MSGATKFGEIWTLVFAAFACCTIIGMIWGIPMILRCNKRLKGQLPITVGHGIISLIFFGFVGGICILVGGDLGK